MTHLRLVTQHPVERRLHKRRLHTLRMARLRERQRLGLQVAPVLYDNSIIELLLDLKWLPVADSENPRQVGVAICDLLKDLAKAPREQL